MPRPTDVVFRNFDELTYIASEDIVPRLPSTPTYPRKLLVNLVESNPDGSCEYWLLESGKTLRISTPSNRPMRSPPRTRQKKTHSPHRSKSKTLSPIKLLKSKSPFRSLPTTTPPPISPCQSFCYPPLRPPYSSFSSRLKFWKRTKSEKTLVEEAESNTGMENQGSEFERIMWKAERDLSASSRSWSSELFIDPGDISATTDNTTENQLCKNLVSSSKRTVSSSSSSTLKYCHSRSRSSSTLPPIMESIEPLEQCYRPQTVSPHDTMRLETTFNNKHERTEQYSPEYIQCPIFNYQGNPDWDKSPFIEQVLVRYFSIPFCTPWVVVAAIKLVFGWIPFFSRLVDFITSNGGATVLFLLSHLGLGLAALPLFILVPFVGGPVCLVHRLVVLVFRNMPWYGFKYSLGCPGVLEDDECRT